MNKKTEQIPLIIIGASAGGIRALEAFFKSFDEKLDASFIIVLHMKDNDENHLGKLLSNYTSMDVKAISEKMKLEKGKIYINPPGKTIGIENDKFYISGVDSATKEHPIDTVLREISSNSDSKLAAVILSGAGSDGSLGIKGIKEKGGIIIVQDPKQAEFDGMPLSAIDTGITDITVPAEEIIENIKSYLKFGSETEKSKEFYRKLDDQNLQSVFKYLRSHTGNDFSKYKKNTIIRRIEKRMSIHHETSIEKYIAKLKDNSEEAETLGKEFLISVTNFFRDEEAFDALKKRAITPLLEGDSQETFRIWVPGCSTGEEAYSIAIMFAEVMEDLKVNPDIQIFATDVDEDAIDKARRGIYKKNIETDVSKERLVKYFYKEADEYKVKKSVREMLIFAPHNVLTSPPFNKLDLISCRNLLIYIDSDTQDQLFTIFSRSLKDKGYLFLGSSENINSQGKFFETMDFKNKIYYKKEGINYNGLLMTDFPNHYNENEVIRSRKEEKTEQTLSKLTETIILSNYSYPAVLINRNNRILYFYGETYKFLHALHGEASFDIFKMAPPKLHHKLRTALQNAKSSSRISVEENLGVKFNNDDIFFDLVVQPVKAYSKMDEAYLIIFKEKPAPPKAKYESEKQDKKEYEGIQYKSLQDELESVKENLQIHIEELQTSNEDLQATNEDLQATNEELQAKNEELQSTNEELETSREEIKSTNEELTTVNNELKSNLQQLSRANNDISNLLKSTEIATLFLDQKLKIKKFTPRLKEIFNLIPSDVGRSISDINIKLNYPEIFEDAQKVLETLEKVNVEKLSRDNEWYNVRILPYRTSENIIEGVVITFLNITNYKALSRMASIIAEAREAIILFNEEGNITSWNRGAEKLYGYSENEAFELTIFDTIPDNEQENFKKLLNKVYEKGFVEVKFNRKLKDGTIKTVWNNMVKLEYQNVDMKYEIACIEREITESNS